MIVIEINNEQTNLAVDEARLRQAIEQVLADADIQRGEISVAVIGDDLMQRLNAQYLNHDWPTDVLSFVHDADAKRLDGEVIVSADTALRQAAKFDWRAEDELLLYVIHGALHLIGHDDHEDEDRAAMRAAERRHLARFQLQPRYEENVFREAAP